MTDPILESSSHTAAEYSMDDSNASTYSAPLPTTLAPTLPDFVGSGVSGSQSPASFVVSSPAVSSVTGTPAVAMSPYTQAVAAPIVMRALIITSDASVIIGKQGRHINEIRELSGARLNISESIPSNPERILTVSGALDAVSKAFGLIVRRINDEPFDQPSLPGSRAAAIRFIIPNSRMGSIIGKQGSKIKEIQEASGARLHAGETMLPGSTERILSITGVADALHIAVYYVGTILLEHPDRNSNNLPYRPSSIPRTMATPQFSPAVSSPASSSFGFNAAGSPQTLGTTLAPGLQTQQIFIPNDLVGCIIGKGGQKINEIRQLSASHIKIMERSAGIAAGGTGSERLVTITGPPPNIQMAVTLLYQRLEQEKIRLSQNPSTLP
ncbi:Similar to S.cerevisiae protein PBP2 (RNA binding protein) [Malassezia sympodialis ATCC 42132]|uniref:Similar to S.cerevisiae protein PBP2 (RNA binding protein) n=1 Tax=Malassezia sympodialis (strain ATCC 42132) TaxID=1230383 RepID=A0A1M8A740_MALS4|nr:Similar to S.cerevisiae protein PBP2 (RNA binding protein) [Malassezia sympodialis ATCC 42132]